MDKREPHDTDQIKVALDVLAQAMDALEELSASLSPEQRKQLGPVVLEVVRNALQQTRKDDQDG